MTSPFFTRLPSGAIHVRRRDDQFLPGTVNGVALDDFSSPAASTPIVSAAGITVSSTGFGASLPQADNTEAAMPASANTRRFIARPSHRSPRFPPVPAGPA